MFLCAFWCRSPRSGVVHLAEAAKEDLAEKSPVRGDGNPPQAGFQKLIHILVSIKFLNNDSVAMRSINMHEEKQQQNIK